jgi:putative endonuclease
VAVTQKQPAHLRQGRNAEHRACEHLGSYGLTLIERNYRAPFGEIDLIMEHQHTIVFVEVRYRRSQDYGTPAETINPRKQAKLRATAAHYLQRHKSAARRPCRFDVVAVSGGAGEERIEWLQNAF